MLHSGLQTFVSPPTLTVCAFEIDGHRGNPAGTAIKLGPVDVYIATPPAEKSHQDAAILYLGDVLGMTVNAKLMADQFAANGYLTIVPDQFNTDCLPPNITPDFDFLGWINKGTDGDNPHTVSSATLETSRLALGASKRTF